MARWYSRLFAALALATAGVFAAFALQPPSRPLLTASPARSDVRVRTEVIRRTVTVIQSAPPNRQHGSRSRAVGAASPTAQTKTK